MHFNDTIIHKSVTSFLDSSRVRKCKHGEGHVISHRSTCIDWFCVCRYDGTFNSVIQGYHVYKDGWDAPIGGVLYCEQEIGNLSDPCVVAVERAALCQSYCLRLVLCLQFGYCDFLKKAPHRYNFILGGAGLPQTDQQ